MPRNCALFERYERAKFLGAADAYSLDPLFLGNKTVMLVYEKKTSKNMLRYFEINAQRKRKAYCWTLTPDTSGLFWSWVSPIRSDEVSKTATTCTILFHQSMRIRSHRSSVKAKRRAAKLSQTAVRRLEKNRKGGLTK